MNKMISKIQKQMHLEAKRYKKNEQRLIKIIEKKNYEAFHAIPENLKNHKLQNPNSFYLQILGCRGAGKSTFINHCMKKSGFDSFDYRPQSSLWATLQRKLQIRDSETRTKSLIRQLNERWQIREFRRVTYLDRTWKNQKFLFLKSFRSLLFKVSLYFKQTFESV